MNNKETIEIADGSTILTLQTLLNSSTNNKIHCGNNSYLDEPNVTGFSWTSVRMIQSSTEITHASTYVIYRHLFDISAINTVLN
jgi:hypothetical protein